MTAMEFSILGARTASFLGMSCQITTAAMIMAATTSLGASMVLVGGRRDFFRGRKSGAAFTAIKCILRII